MSARADFCAVFYGDIRAGGDEQAVRGFLAATVAGKFPCH